ncbi:MAG: NAD-dependent epimerase/dehydratase family protein [Candidatus Hodarchaeota archaeon]
MSKVLITGGAGFIGSHLIERFMNDVLHSEIIVIDNLSTGHHNKRILKSFSIKLVVGDIESEKTLETLPKDIEVIIHLAAMNRASRSIKDPVKSNVVNINGTVNVLEMARKLDCRVIFTSSSSVFGHLSIMPRPENTSDFLPSHPYGLGKMTSEHYCRLYHELYGLDSRVIRYFAVYGPRQSPKLTYSAVIPKFINAALCRHPIKIFGGNQTRNFTFVKDTVEATYLLSTAQKVKHRIYQVGGTEEISINQLADTLEEILGKKLERQYYDYAKGDIFRSIPAINHLKEEFGFVPTYKFREGLKETFEWFKAHPNYFD